MAFTKIVGAGIHTLSNVHSHNINSSGIITATSFVGPFNGSDGDFSGNVTIDGNLVVNGDTTTLNTTLREVEILRVDANSSAAAGIITQRGSGDILRLYDTNAQVVTVADGGNVTLKSTNPVVNIQGTNASSTSEANLNFILRDGNSADRTIGKVVGRTNGNGGYGALDFYTAFNNSNTKRMSISSAGDVTVENGFFAVTDPSEKIGVGVASPTKPLHIYTAGADAEIRLQTNSGTEQNSYISLRHATGHLDFYTVQSGTNMKFHIANNERLKLEDSGLTVTGNVNIASGDIAFLNNNHKIHNSSSAGNVTIQGGSTYAGGRIVLSGGYSSGGGTGDIRFYADTTTTPVERLCITSGGNVGIGSEIPAGKLEIADDAQTNLLVLKRTSGNSGTFSVQLGGSDPGVLLTTSGISDDFIFRPGGTEKFRFTSGGVLNVPAGIGPQLRFENQHSVTTDAAISTFDDATGTLLCLGSNFYMNSSGAETRYNTSEESAGIVINRNGSMNFLTGGTGATATGRFSIRSDGRVLLDNNDGTFTIGGDNVYDNAKINLMVGSSSQTSATTEVTALVIHDQNSRRNGTEGTGSWKSKIVFRSTQINGNSVSEGASIVHDITYNNYSSTKMRSDLVFKTRGDAQTASSDAATEKLRIRHDGKIGIGLAPSTGVDIGHDVHIRKGSGEPNGQLIIQSHDTASSNAQIQLLARDNSNNNETCVIKAMNATVSSQIDLWLYTNNTTNQSIRLTGNDGAAYFQGANSSGLTYQFYNAETGGSSDTRILLKTYSNQGADPYIKFDSGGSNHVVGQLYAGTTNNKLVLGVGESPSGGVSGIHIAGDGNTQVTNHIYMTKASDPRIYAGSSVGLNIDGQALYLNRYVNSTIAMGRGGGDVEVSNTVSGQHSQFNIYKSTGNNSDQAILRVGYNGSNCYSISRTRNSSSIQIDANQSDAIVHHTNTSDDTMLLTNRNSVHIAKLAPMVIQRPHVQSSGSWGGSRPYSFTMRFSTGNFSGTYHVARMISQHDWGFSDWTARVYRDYYSPDSNSHSVHRYTGYYSGHTDHVLQYNQRGGNENAGYDGQSLSKNTNLGPGGAHRIHESANGGYYKDAYATDYYVSLGTYSGVMIDITVFNPGGYIKDTSTSLTDTYPASFGNSASQSDADSWNGSTSGGGRGLWFNVRQGVLDWWGYSSNFGQQNLPIS